MLISGFDGVAYPSKIGGLLENNAEGRPLFPLYVVEVDIPRMQGTVLDFDVPKISSPKRSKRPLVESEPPGRQCWRG